MNGNHGGQSNLPDSTAPGDASPWRTLHDEIIQPAPGLFLAGRRHLSWYERRQRTPAWNPDKNHSPGSTILLAHVPVEAESAARTGVGLMLSGHTHGGQLWPLSIVTRMLNPLVSGQYIIKGMTLLVCRGTGTWGPRMRLWHPGEIMLITLRSR